MKEIDAAIEALEKSQDYVEASSNAKVLAGWGEQLDRAEAALAGLRSLKESGPVAWRVWRGDAYELFFEHSSAVRRGECFIPVRAPEPLFAAPTRPADDLAEPVYIRTLCKALDAALDFAGTVGGGSSWWDEVWADLDNEIERTRVEYFGTHPAPEAKQEPDQRFINLLCRIHRDGGHYIAEHGLDRAAADADILVAELFAMHGEPPVPAAKQEKVPLSEWQMMEHHIAELEAELQEQARVNGMGGEREAALLAKNVQLLKALKRIMSGVSNMERDEKYEQARAAIKAAEGEL